MDGDVDFLERGYDSGTLWARREVPMATTLLSGGYVEKFGELVANAEKVQIASAWMTESGALEALLKREKCTVQAIIGIRGNATSPASLQSLAKVFRWESLRIADGSELFHPKLVLFHYRDSPAVAWIGSANFTGHGMAANIELLLQTDGKRAVSQMGGMVLPSMGRAANRYREGGCRVCAKVEAAGQVCGVIGVVCRYPRRDLWHR